MNVFIIGKIGSGKSTVAEMFSAYDGVNLIDADKIARDVLNVPDVQKELLETFGELMLEGDEIIPESLAEKAFQDKESVEKLNSIMHPKILDKIEGALTEQINIIDIPLPEIGREHIDPDVVIRVECPDELILERVADERKLERQKFITLPKKADHIIDNAGSYEETQAQVEKIWQQLK